jgi:hypothetical protein
MSVLGRDRVVVRHIEIERALARLGLSKRAVGALIRAGISGPRSLVSVPWTDEEAGARFSSLRWRLSTDPGCGPKTVNEVERVRAALLTGQPGSADRIGLADHA